MSDAGRWVRTQLYRFRCPACWDTTTLLPDCLLPGLQHSLETIQVSIWHYLRGPASYRQVALSWSSARLPAGETGTLCWGSPVAPSPTPSSIWRWVHRFAWGAVAWWWILLPWLQARLSQALVLPPVPDYLPGKAQTAQKATQLSQAWYLLYLLGLLLSLLGRPSTCWPQVLLHHQGPPVRDHSHWFVAPSRAPPY